MYDAPSWRVDGADWPHRSASQFVQVGESRWHVQRFGSGPVLLLVHGTGASTHSWRAIAPLLARHFTVVAPDLPGHGFSETRTYGRLSLPGMTRSLHALLDHMNVSPVLVAGHSAGAAILVRMALDGRLRPAGIVSLNGALMPFKGLAGQIFPPMAKVLFLNPLVPRLFARSANDRGRVEKLIRGTGSAIEPEGIELYQRLFRRSGHVAGALGMMANWDLEGLVRDMPRLATPLLLVVGANDRATPAGDAKEIEALAKQARVHTLKGVGHLAHEEDAAAVADVIGDFARSVGVLAEVA